MIRQATTDDADSVSDIYNYYIKNSIATFEEIEVSIDTMCKRIEEVLKNFPWIIYENDKIVLGYAYARKWKERLAYRFTVETTVYVRHDHFGKGIGEKLLSSLIEECNERKLHCLLGGIALPNDASIRLHEKLGFNKCGELKEVGFKFGEWIDVGYWQKILR